MKIWKKNVIVATVLVFVCAGIYLNWIYSKDKAVPDLASTLNQEKIMNDATLVMNPADPDLVAAASEDLNSADNTLKDYFATVRLSRQEARDQAVSMLQETIAYAGEDENVSEASVKLQDIVNDMLQEAQIESLVIAKGYTDCVAYISDDGISLAVAAADAELERTDVAVISDIVMSQTDITLANIHITPVK